MREDENGEEEERSSTSVGDPEHRAFPSVRSQFQSRVPSLLRKSANCEAGEIGDRRNGNQYLESRRFVRNNENKIWMTKITIGLIARWSIQNKKIGLSSWSVIFERMSHVFHDAIEWKICGMVNLIELARFENRWIKWGN